MKKFFLSLTIALASCFASFAQSFPYGINYQAVARDANGNAKTNQAVNVRFSINKTTASGTLIWQEINATATTNNMGQFNVVIGSGTTTGGGSATSFATIDWSADLHWLTVDIFNGTVYVPIASQQFQAVPYALNAVAKVPTMQKFLSGSGTYTTPSGVLYIEVEMVGGGGGGSGSGTATPAVAGATGGNTIFGISLLVANGGGGGTWNSFTPVGGTASLGSGPIGVAIQGAGSAGGIVGSSGNQSGTKGGDAPYFSGGGTGGFGSTSLGINGGVGVTNTGGGGGGAGIDAAGTNLSGTGGASGGYVKAIISAPSGSYSYTVGSGGAGGLAGTSGAIGGAGAAGIIIVKEYYK